MSELKLARGGEPGGGSQGGVLKVCHITFIKSFRDLVHVCILPLAGMRCLLGIIVSVNCIRLGGCGWRLWSRCLSTGVAGEALAMEETLALGTGPPVLGSTVKYCTAEPTCGIDFRGICTILKN